MYLGQLHRVGLGLVCSAVLLWGQPPPGSRGEASAEASAEWERAKQRLEQWKTLRLLEELRLDEQRTNQFLARYTAYNRRIDSALRRLDLAAQRLSLALQMPQNADDIQRSLQELLRQQQELYQLLQQRTEALRPLLSEEQFARYVLFEYRFPREIERALFHRWHQKKPKR